MKRLLVILLCLSALGACTDDRVELSRGPLGPAHYEVEVRAAGNIPGIRTYRRADLRVTPRPSGAIFRLRPNSGSVITADVFLPRAGTIFLQKVRGTGAAVQADLASLIGQLNPSLPRRSVRLGEKWSSTQEIATDTLGASLRTELRIVRFRRMASTDAAEFVGDVSGQLRTRGPRGSFSGRLNGETQIVWAVRAGRVVAADTRLVWTIASTERVTLETRVRPR